MVCSHEEDIWLVTEFICRERLGWVPLSAEKQRQQGSAFEHRSSTLFEEPSDFQVLHNDWPYGFEPSISHIVVWLKTPIPVDPRTGQPTAAAQEQIESFVQMHFTESLGGEEQGADRVMWFKNWLALQSVPSLEHFHVLVRDVTPTILDAWTRPCS